ncbi:MAG: LysR family transcriptional regulator [Nitrococcus sp.]|nr:LysR family transcriptional regulator [Nitrococcus sp.]
MSIWIDLPGGHRIGPGEVLLLEAIEETGSISAAGRKMGMSFSQAWHRVKKIDGSLMNPAVGTKTGGYTRQGATLTPLGKQLIKLYRSIEHSARSGARQDLKAVQRLVGTTAIKRRSASSV